MKPVVLLCAFFAISVSVKLPSTFQKCDRSKSDFNQCLQKAVEGALSQLTKPLKEVGLVSFEPLEIPSLSISPGTNAAQFTQNYNNLKIYGFNKATFTKFDVDFDKKTITFECIFPKVRLESEYDFKGRILVIPFNGQGPALIKLDNLHFTFTFNLEEYDKDGEKHYKIKDSKLIAKPELIHFQLDNLFGGDEALGKHINDVFNENWSALWEDLESSYEEAFGQIFSNIFGRFLEKVPISEIFA